MKVLNVSRITKVYPSFKLREVSFGVEKGTIMGLIGRNGAGKSTVLKSILNIVHADSGTVTFFDMDMKQNESEIKQRIGYAGGTVDFFKKRKIRDIIAVTKCFYKDWDEKAYQKYMKLFELSEEKTPSELSQGMKVKLNLVMALSHKAELLILDEPTSGLDPVSREEILMIFKYLKSQGVSILFSTHITSDLEKCADEITYIREGEIVYSGSLDGFMQGQSLDDVMMEYEKEAFYEKFDL